VCDIILGSTELRLRIKGEPAITPALRADAGGRRGGLVLQREPLSVEVVELPGSMFETRPEIAILAIGGHVPYRPLPLTISLSGSEQLASSASVEAARGLLLNPVLAAPGEVVDKQNILEVEFEREPLLTSCDQAALLAGRNLLWLNGEFIQFATAKPLGAATYELSDLIRGRFDSEAVHSHESGSKVLILSPDAMAKIKVPRERIGSMATARVHGPDDTVAEATLTIMGLAARPWTPAHVVVEEAHDGLTVSWVRRCKEGAPWLDEVDAPLGSTREQYLLRLADQLGSAVELRTDSTSAHFDAQALSSFGPRPWRLEVRQVGDFSASKASSHIID
jgi:hypothetical protein